MKVCQLFPILTIVLIVFLSGCVQQTKMGKIEARPECGNYLPKGWICPPSKEFIEEQKLKRIEEVKVGSIIGLYNFTINSTLQQSKVFVENVPKSFLTEWAEFFIEVFVRIATIPLEVLGNVSVKELKNANVKIYEAEGGKKFAAIYLTFKNLYEDEKIVGRVEGVLITDKQKLLPKYFINKYGKLTSVEQLGNYTIWDLATYSMRANSSTTRLFIFEIGEDEKPIKFIFNTTYTPCKLICIGELGLRNMGIRLSDT